MSKKTPVWTHVRSVDWGISSNLTVLAYRAAVRELARRALHARGSNFRQSEAIRTNTIRADNTVGTCILITCVRLAIWAARADNTEIGADQTVSGNSDLANFGESWAGGISSHAAED